jgi:hypothetical protein
MTEEKKKTAKKAGKKDSQLLLRINSVERDTFVALCEELDTSAAREVRKFIRTFIKENTASQEN